ncbi:MAG: hypothetical protein AYK18_13405 [Theionarchaea archaeon DG-70]|nr:MAG: hypothetical protein AYK18_13405 [Theionarchaea archaeon DG-70]
MHFILNTLYYVKRYINVSVTDLLNVIKISQNATLTIKSRWINKPISMNKSLTKQMGNFLKNENGDHTKLTNVLEISGKESLHNFMRSIRDNKYQNL